MPIFRQEGEGFVPFDVVRFEDLERVLEDWIEANPHVLLEEPLAIVARQARSREGILDLLAVDRSGACVIIELKRGQTPRDVIAQGLDYAAWVDELSQEDLDELCRSYHARRGLEERDLAAAYAAVFRDDGEAEDSVSQVSFNTRQRLILVAEVFTPGVERTLRYLRTKHGVDIIGVRFGIHRSGDDTLLETEVLVGREAPARAADKAPGARTWSTDAFLARLAENNPADVQVAHSIHEWATQRDLRITFGDGLLDTSLFPVLDLNGRSYWPVAVRTTGVIEVLFQHMKRPGYQPPFDQKELRQELAERLNAISGVTISMDALERRPNFRLSLLKQPAARHLFLATLDWYFAKAANQSSEAHK